MEEELKKEKKNIKKKKKFGMSDVLMIVFFLIALGCAGYLLKYYYDIHHAQSTQNEVKDLIEDYQPEDRDLTMGGNQYIDVNGKMILKRFAKIYETNPDFVGWLTIPDTVVNYCVMQTPEDEEYYLRKDFFGNYSTAGCLLADTSSDLMKPSDNTIIYGHNMKAGTMFHCILEYAKQDYYEKHKMIYFDTIYNYGTYEVVAAYYTQIYPVDSDEFKYYTFFDAKDEEEFDNFVSESMKKSTITTDYTPKYGDKLLTLSTCSYHVKNGRFVVIAVKTDNEEYPYKD